MRRQRLRLPNYLEHGPGQRRISDTTATPPLTGRRLSTDSQRASYYSGRREGIEVSMVRRRVGPYQLVSMSLNKHRFLPHTHNSYVMSLNITGIEYVMSSDLLVSLGRDDISLLNTGEVDSSHSFASPWEFISLYIDRSVADIGRWRFNKPYINSRLLADGFRRLAQTALFSRSEDGAIETEIAVLVRETLGLAGSPAISPAVDDAADYKIKQRLVDPSGRTEKLKNICEEIGISVPELVRRFKRANGLPPSAWTYDIRLKHALSLMEKSVPLAQIAAELGYSDQAHFSRRFKAAIGVSPGVWRGNCITMLAD